MSKTNTTMHQMRPFTGADGKTYQRRADIKLWEWRRYIQALDTIRTQDQEAYWIGLFMGYIEPETLNDANIEAEQARLLAIAEQVANEGQRLALTATITEYFNDQMKAIDARRIALADELLAEMPIDVYMAVHGKIIDDILYPASPKNDQAQTTKTMTMPDEAKETAG